MTLRFETLMESMLFCMGMQVDRDLVSPLELEVSGIHLTLHYDNRSLREDLIITADLGLVPPEAELEAYRAFLEGNLLWSGTADATIGVNSDTREALMAYRTSLEDLDGKSLAELCLFLLDVAGEWRGFLLELGRGGDECLAFSGIETGLIRI